MSVGVIHPQSAPLTKSFRSKDKIFSCTTDCPLYGMNKKRERFPV